MSDSQIPSAWSDIALNTEELEVPVIKKPRKKVRGAYHDARYTKVTSTIHEKRKAKKIERQRRKAGR